jgi:plasmid stabilization system protein ParE
LEQSVRLEWSARALGDLDRFAAFLHDRDPRLAEVVAREIMRKAEVLLDHPELGKSVESSAVYREVVLQVLNALYVFQYRYDGERLVMLRVFHGREARE